MNLWRFLIEDEEEDESREDGWYLQNGRGMISAMVYLQ